MSRTRLLWSSLALIVVISIGTFVFFSHYHYVESVIWQSFKGKAKTDPYHLTEQFLTRKGYQVTRHRSYARLNDNTLEKGYDTLFFTNNGHTLNEAQITTVLDWVNHGGHVVLAASEENTLLNHAGIRVKNCPTDKCACSTNTEEQVDQQANAILEAVTDSLSNNTQTPEEKADQLLSINHVTDSSRISVGKETLYIDVRHAPSIQTLPDTDTRRIYRQNALCYGDLFALFSHGEGYISIYGSSPRHFATVKRWWSDPPLLIQHHASFLDLLLQLGGNGKRVLWYESAAYQSIWELLWRYGRFALVAAALLLLAWIWQHSRRFGPLLVEDPRAGLSMQRHLLASGRFYYRQQQQSKLLQHSYDALDTAIARRIPSAKRLSKPTLAQQLSAKTGLSPDDILTVLARRYPQTDTEFTHLVHLINRIQQSL